MKENAYVKKHSSSSDLKIYIIQAEFFKIFCYMKRMTVNLKFIAYGVDPTE